MATKQCHTCKHNGAGDKACITCKFRNVGRSSKAIDLSDSIPTPEPEPQKTEKELAEFFREWLFLPPRLRDVFAAFYVNRFSIAETARALNLGTHQVSYARDALKEHAYFAKFFEASQNSQK